jgi:murein DD-endopeptidase MepM/ murein hydrolase activator NlpD
MICRRGIASFFLPALVLAFWTFPAKLSSEDVVHVVAQGETVYSISHFYRVSQTELMRFNNIPDPGKLQVGQRLRIPPPLSSEGTTTENGGVSTASPAAAPYIEYRVVKNDTLYSLARKHGVKLKALCDANGFSGDYKVKVGELIKIPKPAAAKAPAVKTTTAAPPPTESTVKQPEPRQTARRPVDTALRWPVTPKGIDYMTGKLYGVVLQAERSEPVRSLTQGTVVSAGPYRGFSRVAIVETAGGYLYVYGGCESLSVKEGDRIGPGTELGKVGVDAVTGKPQLFFMVYRNNAPVDPAKAPRA